MVLLLSLVLLFSLGGLLIVNYIPAFEGFKDIALDYLNILNLDYSLLISASLLGWLFLYTVFSGKKKPFTHIATVLTLPVYYFTILSINTIKGIAIPFSFKLFNSREYTLLALAGVIVVYSLSLVFLSKMNKLLVFAKNNKKRKVDNIIKNTKEEEIEEIVVPINPKSQFDFPDIPSTANHEFKAKGRATGRKAKVKEVIEADEIIEVAEPEVKEQKYNLNDIHKFKTGGIFESSLEAAVYNQDIQVEKPTTPIYGYNDKKTLEEKALKRKQQAEALEAEVNSSSNSFAPSNLDESHPRFKMFQNLRKPIRKPIEEVKETPVTVEENISVEEVNTFAPKGLDENHPRYKIFQELSKTQTQAPVVDENNGDEIIEELFAPKGLDKNHPRYKMFESLNRPKTPVEAPVTPSYQAPQYTEPVAPSYQAPQYTEPVAPSYQAPQYTEPVAPSYQAPQYSEPVSPSYQAQGYNQAAADRFQSQAAFTSETRQQPPLAQQAEVAPTVKKVSYNEYHFPTDNLVNDVIETNSSIGDEEYELGHYIAATLKEFKVEIKLVNITKGPTITMFEYHLAPGLVISKVVNLTPNISLATGGQQIRVLAPIPGKNAIGIEIPNKKRSTVGFKAMLPALRDSSFKIPIILGKNNLGTTVLTDIAKAPHILIAGTTGSGKSVCINTLICSILYTRKPEDVRMILVDPKVVELKVYNNIPHLLTPVITDLSKVMKVLQWVVDEMERRFSLFGQVGARNIGDFNSAIRTKNLAVEKMPSILLILDEFADIKLQIGKEIENSINRLMAKSRAAGIHVIIATQRPSAEVITGTIKNNIPTRIAFSVPANINSRIILDEGGAENLLGSGDMLFMATGKNDLERIQCSYLDDDEIEKIVEHIKKQAEPDYLDESLFEDDDELDDDVAGPLDPSSMSIYDQAKEIVFEKRSASASYLQRRLSIGYNKAAKIIEQMEDEGIIGPANGSKPREILRFDL